MTELEQMQATVIRLYERRESIDAQLFMAKEQVVRLSATPPKEASDAKPDDIPAD